jgi:hypothetical protein
VCVCVCVCVRDIKRGGGDANMIRYACMCCVQFSVF